MDKIVDYDQLFPGRFMKAGEFQGRDVTLTVTNIELEDLPQEKGGDRARGIISFRETKKKLVLNRTNGECIKGMFGRNVQDWIGKKVTFFPSEWNGEPCIRVKGSPELSASMDLEVKLPKRKPLKMRMQVTGKKANGKPVPAMGEEGGPEPPINPDDDQAVA